MGLESLPMTNSGQPIKAKSLRIRRGSDADRALPIHLPTVSVPPGKLSTCFRLAAIQDKESQQRFVKAQPIDTPKGKSSLLTFECSVRLRNWWLAEQIKSQTSRLRPIQGCSKVSRMIVDRMPAVVYRVSTIYVLGYQCQSAKQEKRQHAVEMILRVPCRRINLRSRLRLWHGRLLIQRECALCGC